MKRILVLDGGGVKGFATLEVVRSMELTTGKRCHELFDMIVGTSVGAIIGAALATGRYSADEIMVQMKAVVPRMFTPRFLSFPKYDRETFIKFWVEKYGRVLMRDLKTKYFCTSVNLVDSTTHYFKSWETKDGALPVVDAVTRSFAAPVFFGAIIDETEKAVWTDGGTGEENCPLLESIVEALRQQWLGAGRVHILSIGAGSADISRPFDRVKKYQWFRQAMTFLSPADGGLARRQSTADAVQLCRSLMTLVPRFTMQRIDTIIPKFMDKLDGVWYIDQYRRYGAEMATGIDYTLFEEGHE